MKHLAIRLFLYICIAMVPLACGSRKAAVSITENKAVQDTKSTETVKSTQNTTNSATEAKTSTQTNNSEAVSTTNVKRYDENGKLREERTTVSNKKKSGTKNTTNNRTFNVTDYRLTNMERTITTHVKVSEYSKDKETDTNNKPLYWMLFGVGVVGLIIWGALKWFKS